jgi:hypothetical protein
MTQSSFFITTNDISRFNAQVFKIECLQQLEQLDKKDCVTALSCAEASSSFGYPKQINFYCRSIDDAQLLCRQYKFFSTQLQHRSLQQLHFFWDGCEDIPLSVGLTYDKIALYQKDFFMSQASEILTIPRLQIATMQISSPILQVLFEFLEYPERRSGLVRVEDQRQVAMTQASIVMTSRNNLIEAVTYKREDYVHPEDLEDLLRSLDDLEPDNPSSIIEVSFRADINHTNYRRFVNRYRRVTDAFGNLFEVAENLDILEPAIAP